METVTESFTWDATLWWTAAAILALLLMSAFFSGSETALTAASRAKLHQMAEKGSRGAALALKLTEDSERLIGAVLLGNNLVNILATSLATSLFTALFGDSGVALATLFMTLLVLIFAEVMPKTYAITNAEPAAALVSPPLTILVRLLSPVVSAVRWFVRLMLWLFGVRADADARIMALEEIKGAITLHHSEGTVEKDDRDRLLGALDLANRTVDEVMMHRSNIYMLDGDTPPLELIDEVLKAPYTRIPIWQGDQENIVGVIHAKDLLREINRLARLAPAGVESLAQFDVMTVVMEPWFVPETTTLNDQMREFLHRRSHFALVVDEYGALQGLITLEDILEEIVGDITDEHDEEVHGVTADADGAITVDGTTSIRDINRAMDWQLPDEEANTVAGLVIHEAQSIPTAGQVFSFHGFRFEVLERQRNQLKQVKVKRL
ncbi:HlyC/CorC family transporter [Paroceanicella profunda]|uniref:HlyC/CorC family transporter n=1 Tax=Paroceanicella profunda TaxID=2579971 RepID=A0A5B8FVS0_9RHOB|nr:HlyC/CorC family transporter [Paroceanicella profunda]QDL92916.1 HlyC/CorC family transporter [Paroceanicella profunda]